MEVIRTFHPIGQGAFYSERFINDGNDVGIVVYDCGSNNKNVLKRAIPGCFTKDAEIDILFISHFDSDHVNGIATLKNNYRIKTVILPLVRPLDKIILKIYNYASKGKRAYQETRLLIENPKVFFKSRNNDTKVILVLPTEESRGEFVRNAKSLNEFQSEKIIDSYQGINFKEWIYIPFNYQEEARMAEFKYALEEEGITIKDWNDNLFNDDEIINKIKRAYNRLPGEINGNSLMLYSGAFELNTHSIYGCQYPEIHPLCFRYCIRNLDGCLYLGDADLNESEMFRTLKDTLHPYTQRIGLIQIPHHGSKDNFNSEILNLNTNNRHYVLSYGTQNQYGHPSHYVASSVLSTGKYLAMVNENSPSIFIQRTFVE